MGYPMHMPKLIRTCETCGRTFTAYPSRAGRFCSRRCTGAFALTVSIASRRDSGPERFWSKVDRGGADECWDWLGRRSAGRYGAVTWHGRETKAHRVAWEMANGRPVPSGLVVRHDCDNTICCNPAHLSVGTQADNMADAVMRGRISHLGNRTLTEAIVRDARRRHAAGESAHVMAAEYGVTVSGLRKAIYRSSWQHVK